MPCAQVVGRVRSECFQYFLEALRGHLFLTFLKEQVLAALAPPIPVALALWDKGEE